MGNWGSNACKKVFDFVEVHPGDIPDCEGMTEIILPNCKKVGIGAFEDFQHLTKISLPICTSVREMLI